MYYLFTTMASKQKELDNGLGTIEAFVKIFYNICFSEKVPRKVVLLLTINEK